MAVVGLQAGNVRAHMMVAQHGTLNIVGDGIYMVLSAPVSAFPEIDDDGDHLMSMTEFQRHRAAIVDSIYQQVVLRDMRGSLPLQGIMLSPVTEHDVPGDKASQLLILGRYSLGEPNGPLHFRAGLFGETADEQVIEMTVTRQSDGLAREFELTPSMPADLLFPADLLSWDWP
jgi:hypothetical protein